MEGDRGRQGQNPNDRSLKRSASESSLSSSSNRLREESALSSNSAATPELGAEELSSMWAAADSTGEFLERILRQRTDPPSLEDLVPSGMEQMGPILGGSSSEQAGLQNSSSWQSGGSVWQTDLTQNPGQVVIVLDTALAQSGGIPQANDPRLRSRLISEVREAMGLQGMGGTIQYRTHTRFPGYWRLSDVVYVPDEIDENEGMRLDIDHMSYEELLALGEGIGTVSTGLGQEVIMARLRQRKYSHSATGPSAGEETCCICQEEYAEEDEVGKLDCKHEYHVCCIREWLEKTNWCPICKKTALAPIESNPHQQ